MATKQQKARDISRVAERAIARDQKVRDQIAKSLRPDPAKGGKHAQPHLSRMQFDSFVNFAQRMGVGADNALSTAGYGFNPISRIRTTLEWMHRGSWLAGAVVDTYADDMTRMGVELKGDIKPADMERIHESATTLGVITKIKETVQWSRLYGGCLAVMLIDGQDTKTPLRMEAIGKNQFRGLLVLDRWMLEPSLNDLVTEMGPDLGMPKYYRVTADAPALPRLTVHHSRCVRLEGISLPYWQRLQENLWGISVLERMYDRMIAFDSATTGAAQLVYKAYIRTYKVKDLRQIIANGGPALTGLIAQIDFMRRFQGQEGITLMDGEDEFEGKEQNSFQGLDAALTQFGQQLSGACGIPLVRLFGQSPHGFNGGETDIRNYYDNIKQKQSATLTVPLTKIYRAIGQSEGIKLPEGFGILFPSLWQLTDKEKSEIAETTERAVQAAEESGYISQKVAMEELRQSSHITGIFTNISDKNIAAAEDAVLPPAPPMVPGAVPGEEGAGAPDDDATDLDPRKQAAVKQKAKDNAIKAITEMKRRHDIDVVVENDEGTLRQGFGWSVNVPYVYGYFPGTVAPDGEGVDCCLGTAYDSAAVWVVNQVKLGSGAEDEPKVLGFYADKSAALRAYIMGYSDGRGPERIGSIQAMDVAGLKTFLAAHRRTGM